MLKKVNDIIIKLISKNFGWKLFSIIMAVVIWFIVMNIINPTEIQSYSVNLTLMNKEKLAEKGFAVINMEELEDAKIEIKVRSTRPALDELTKNKKDIKAEVDLQQFSVLYAEDIGQPIKVSVVPSIPSSYIYTYELVSFSPGTIDIMLDNIVQVEKEIEIETDGEVLSGYLAGKPRADSGFVSVKGAASEISKIGSVKAHIDVDGASSDVIENIEPFVLDESGNVMEGFIIEPAEIEAVVAVYKYGHVPVDSPSVTGVPAKGYRIVSTSWEPKYIEVVGDSDRIAELEKIEIPHFDASGISGNKTMEFDVREFLAERNLGVKTGTPSVVTVTVNVMSEVEKEIYVYSENLTVNGNNSGYNIVMPERIQVKIRGIETELEKIDEEAVKGSIDITALGEGSYDVPVKLELPGGISSDNGSVIRVVLSSEGKEETLPETETVSEEPSETQETEETQSIENVE